MVLSKPSYALRFPVLLKWKTTYDTAQPAQVFETCFWPTSPSSQGGSNSESSLGLLGTAVFLSCLRRGSYTKTKQSKNPNNKQIIRTRKHLPPPSGKLLRYHQTNKTPVFNYFIFLAFLFLFLFTVSPTFSLHSENIFCLFPLYVTGTVQRIVEMK